MIALRRQTDYQFSPNWLSGAEDGRRVVDLHNPCQLGGIRIR
jgi:hypothetical protein